jgi:hypothetical protein
MTVRTVCRKGCWLILIRFNKGHSESGTPLGIWGTLFASKAILQIPEGAKEAFRGLKPPLPRLPNSGSLVSLVRPPHQLALKQETLKPPPRGGLTWTGAYASTPPPNPKYLRGYYTHYNVTLP